MIFLKILHENEIVLSQGGGDLSNTTYALCIRHWTISQFMEISLGLKKLKSSYPVGLHKYLYYGDLLLSMQFFIAIV